MKVWLIQANEPMPIEKNKDRLWRMGLIAEELTKRGHQVRWFSNTFDHYRKEQIYNEDTCIEVKTNYKIDLIWGPGYKKNISVQRIINHKLIAMKFSKIASKLDKPDLIYTSFPTIDYAYAAIKYGKKHNIPVIVDIRDLWPDIFKHNLPRYMQIFAMPYIKLMKHKTKKIMKEAFAINSISEPMLDWGLQKANRKKSKYDRFFYIGYQKANRKEILNNNFNNEFVVCFFATINNQFNYDIIIQIAKKIQQENINIYVCGNGPQFESLKKKAEGIQNIKLLGWIDKEKLNEILNMSKIGLAPYKDTFDFQMSVSNKFAEYLSYGLPIIITTSGYMQELLNNNKCGLGSQNIDEIAKFIIEAKLNTEKYNNMSINATNLYKEKFVAEKIYINLVNYLEEVEEDIRK